MPRPTRSLIPVLLALAALGGCTRTADTATAEARARQAARAIEPVDLVDLGTRIDTAHERASQGEGHFHDNETRQAYLDRLDRLDERLIIVLKNRTSPDFADQVLELDRAITEMEDRLADSETASR